MPGDVRSDGWGRLYQREFDAVAPSVPTSACVVYCALVSCRSATTMRTPLLGIALLMRKTGQTRRTIFRNLTILEDARFITRETVGKRLRFGFPLMNGATSGTQTVPPVAPRTENGTEGPRPQSLGPNSREILP